jgi:Anthrone oxygenase
MLAAYLALTIVAFFTGAAFYINFAEQPARLKLDDRSMLAEWKPAYKRGYVMQATLALLAFILCTMAWWLTGRLAFLLGALLMIANLPWTFFAIYPVNEKLMATPLTDAGLETRELMVKWNRLHAVRTTLGAAAVVTLLAGLLER